MTYHGGVVLRQILSALKYTWNWWMLRCSLLGVGRAALIRGGARDWNTYFELFPVSICSRRLVKVHPDWGVKNVHRANPISYPQPTCSMSTPLRQTLRYLRTLSILRNSTQHNEFPRACLFGVVHLTNCSYLIRTTAIMRVYYHSLALNPNQVHGCELLPDL